MKITPMLEQYLRAKQEHPEALLFFRLGDFYELFFEDAERAARLLDITLTTRSKKDDIPIPMCGMPHFSVQQHIAKLLGLGLKVAICDQMEDPAQAKGIVSRAVVRVITPGTVTEEEYLDPKQPNYLAAVAADGSSYGLAYAELSTGEIRKVYCKSEGEMLEALTQVPPRELLIGDADVAMAARLEVLFPAMALSRLPAARFDDVAGGAWLQARAEQNGTSDVPRGTQAALGAVLWYLQHTHRASLDHLRAPVTDDGGAPMALDEATRRNLELLTTTRGERRGSLLWILDETQTPMGGRRLRQWLLAPLTDPNAIGARLDAVDELLATPSVRDPVSRSLGGIGDLERLIARVASARVNPRDVLGLAAALDAVEAVRASLSGVRSGLLAEAATALESLPELRTRLRATLVDEPPLQSRAGNVIRTGIDPRVDELRDLAHHGKRVIGEMEAAERKRTGISSLKIRYTSAFGYYIEITKANLHLAPEDYRRKQTLVNAERFVTPKLEEYESKVLGAEDKLAALEAQLFDELVAVVARDNPSLARTAGALATLDVIVSFAVVAERFRYARPQLKHERGVVIEEGRHPVVERMAGREGFVPNDTRLDPDEQQILVITGPNMAGKSTYLRQVALITLMAQIGSFVPAARAEIGIVDRLFTRIGASDNLAGGESTFMVEMKETANILSLLTDRSLVILDEIGRGTSTFDGISIAWAVAEHLHDGPYRPLVLFATHYHELTDLSRTRDRVRNLSVAVREWKGEVLFLRRIVEGPASQSYGIQVAQLAGVPQPVIVRAKEILANLEKGELTDAGQPRLASAKRPAPDRQLTLFAPAADALRDELANLDVNELTPLQALTRLQELVEKAKKKS